MKVFGLQLSNEFALLAACCRWPRSAERDETIRQLSAGTLDWTAFAALVKRHRVDGLVHRALGEAQVEGDPAVRQALGQGAAKVATDNLIQAAESLRLSRALESAGIQPLFLKGVTLGVTVFENLAVKQSWDIDLLVAADDAASASRALAAAGYARIYPEGELTPEEVARWMTHSKESLWRRGQSDLYVELHTSLVDNPSLLKGISASSARQKVSVAGGEIATLAREPLYTYLCVHGATHGWSRLKWLADVAALLRKESADEVLRLHRYAESIGGGRSSAQALLLCAELLALPLPETLAAELRADSRTLWLARIAVGAMAGTGATELDDTMFGTIPLNIGHFLLGRGLRYKGTELVRKLSHPEDRLLLPLPPALHFLYPPIAPLMWVWRRYRVSRRGPAKNA